MPPFCLAKVEGGMNVNITRKNTSHVITLSTTDTAEVNKIHFDTGDGFLEMVGCIFGSTHFTRDEALCLATLLLIYAQKDCLPTDEAGHAAT